MRPNEEVPPEQLERISNAIKIATREINKLHKMYPVVALRPFHVDNKVKQLKKEIYNRLDRSPWNKPEDAINYKRPAKNG